MTSNEIQNKQFEKKMGGYRPDEVSEYLASVAAYVKQLESENAKMEEQMLVLAEKLEEYREDESSLRAALIGAQKLGDSVVRDAKKKAEQILTEANAKAEELVGDARSNIDKEAFTLTRMQTQVAEFKAQILQMYKRHVEMINGIPDDYDFPRDVKSLLEQQINEKKKEAAAAFQQSKEESFADTFTVSYEGEEIAPIFVMDDTDDESPESGAAGSSATAGGGAAATGSGKGAKRSSFADLDLHFGKDYDLTRKD